MKIKCVIPYFQTNLKGRLLELGTKQKGRDFKRKSIFITSKRRLSTKQSMLLSCGAGEDS